MKSGYKSKIASKKLMPEPHGPMHFDARGGDIRAQGDKIKGRKSRSRPDKRARGGGKWIQGAIRHPGALHRALHVPEGQKIPAAKLAKAAHSSNPTMRRRANLAKTLKKMH